MFFLQILKFLYPEFIALNIKRRIATFPPPWATGFSININGPIKLSINDNDANADSTYQGILCSVDIGLKLSKFIRFQILLFALHLVLESSSFGIQKNTD